MSYKLIARKNISDTDGFSTEYSWYTTEDGNNVFVFGDSDLYSPEESEFDFETEDFEEAQNWFDNYSITEDEEVAESFEKAGGPFWYFTKHGVQPGSVPKDINILDVLDAKDGTGSYFLSDKVIDIKQLNKYELKELGPDTEYNTEEYYSDDDFNFENELPGYTI